MNPELEQIVRKAVREEVTAAMRDLVECEFWTTSEIMQRFNLNRKRATILMRQCGRRYEGIGKEWQVRKSEWLAFLDKAFEVKGYDAEGEVRAEIIRKKRAA